MTNTEEANNQQALEGAQNRPPALPYGPVTTGDRATYFTLTAFGAGIPLELMGTGGLGMVVAGLGAVGAAYFAPELKPRVYRLMHRNHAGEAPKLSRPKVDLDWWLGKGRESEEKIIEGSAHAKTNTAEIDDDVTEKVPVVGQTAPSSTVAPVFPVHLEDETICIGVTSATGQRFDPHINQLFGAGMITAAVQGAGKSMLNGQILEQVAKCGAPFIAIDWKGEYVSLTELPFVNGFVGGAQGEIDFELTADNAGEFVEIVMTERKHAIVNLRSYGLSWQARAKVVAAVGKALMEYADAQFRSGATLIPCMVLVDEAQLFFPQNKDLLPDEAKSGENGPILNNLSNAFFSLVSNGRSNGYTLCFATQSLTYIAKWAIKSCQVKALMRQTEKNDLDTCEKIINPTVATREDIETLPAGTGVFFGLTSKPMLVKIDKKQSRDLSKTPGIKELRSQRSVQTPISHRASVNTAPMPAPETKRNSKIDLETILTWYDTGRIDAAAMIQLMDRLPVVDADDARYVDADRDTDPAQEVVSNEQLAEWGQVIDFQSRRMADNIPMKSQPATPRLRKELQDALDLYYKGYESYRKLGDAMGIDKDRAGKLIRELQEMGLIAKAN
jgi:hypothetical protein